MSLTPSEGDRLLLFVQGQLARARKDRGLLLNVPESIAFIADSVVEMARDGMSLEQVRAQARALLSASDVLPPVPSIVTEVKVEARFDDGTRLVVVSDPFNAMPVEQLVSQSTGEAESTSTHEQWIDVTNTSTTSIGISSHIHLAEVNPRLRLDREKAYGMRIALPTGDSLWIKPGERIAVPITAIGGDRIMMGNSGVIEGSLADPGIKEQALHRLRLCGYLDEHDGVAINTVEQAQSAVSNLMRGELS